jgi:hypothetical protein
VGQPTGDALRWTTIAVAQSRGAVVFALTKYSHLHLYPVHPSTLVSAGYGPFWLEKRSRYRLAFGVATASRVAAPPIEAGYRTDTRVAISGRGTAEAGG